MTWPGCGTVPSAAAFAAATVAARDTQRNDAAGEAERRSDLARRGEHHR
jgi:hypothetical protein